MHRATRSPSRLARGVLVLLLALASAACARESPAPGGYIDAARLPPEARQTLALVRQGGPFPYERDGVVFGNFERRLPERPRGYYREYTVRTPGAKTRGARRLVIGREGEVYYTDDHYATFRRVRE